MTAKMAYDFRNFGAGEKKNSDYVLIADDFAMPEGIKAPEKRHIGFRLPY